MSGRRITNKKSSNLCLIALLDQGTRRHFVDPEIGSPRRSCCPPVTIRVCVDDPPTLPTSIKSSTLLAHFSTLPPCARVVAAVQRKSAGVPEFRHKEEMPWHRRFDQPHYRREKQPWTSKLEPVAKAPCFWSSEIVQDETRTFYMYNDSRCPSQAVHHATARSIYTLPRRACFFTVVHRG